MKKGIEDIDWEKIRGEVQLGLKKGMKAVRKGTAAVKGKASELTEEAKRQYMVLELKGKVHEWVAELGGKVYELSSKVSNPMTDTTVKSIIARIKKLEAQIERLENKAKALYPKTIKRLQQNRLSKKNYC